MTKIITFKEVDVFPHYPPPKQQNLGQAGEQSISILTNKGKYLSFLVL